MAIKRAPGPQPVGGAAEQVASSSRRRNEMERAFGGPVTFGAALGSERLRLLHGKLSEHLWCTRCNRSFPNGIYRQIGDFRKCPYSGCDAHATVDALPWEQIQSAHPDYPGTPELGALYPRRPPARLKIESLL